MKIKYLASIITIFFISSHVSAADMSGIKIKWGYQHDKGPSYWGKLSPDFLMCSKGTSQSPINIPKIVPVANKKLAFHYHPAPMVIVDDGETDLLISRTHTIINDGHGIQINFPNAKPFESASFQREKYRLVQFHIHTPSENHLEGKTFPAEIHFVHQNPDGKILVIGLFVEKGAENPTLQKIINHLPKEHGKEMVIENEQINPGDLLTDPSMYFNFIGSLTTPPCSEGLRWIVMKHPITATEAQLAQLKKANDGENARPVQYLNDRSVGFTS